MKIRLPWTIVILVLMAGTAGADLIVDGGPARRPERTGPTRLTVDLGPFAASGYWRAEHAVKPGETLYGIARTHLGDGKRWTEFAALNEVEAGSLQIGSKLLMPPKDPPAPGDVPPRYDFFQWAPGTQLPPTPLVPGESFESGTTEGVVVLAVEHAHLEEFRSALRPQNEAAIRAVVAKPWVASSKKIGGIQTVHTGAPVVAFTQSVTLKGISDGVLEGTVTKPQPVMAPPVPAGVMPPPPPPGVVPPSEPAPADIVPPPPAEVPESATEPATEPAMEPATEAAAIPAPATTESDATSGANPVVVAGVILAIVAAAFFALRSMNRKEGEDASA